MSSAETPVVLREIRRFPVKSMGGESLQQVEVDRRGLVGDRYYAVVDEQGRLASGKNTRRFRRRDQVFDFHAATGGDGAVLVTDGSHSDPVGSPALDTRLSERFGDPVRVLPEGSTSHFDAAAVSLVGTATLAWCAEQLQVDAQSRRLRVNLVLETVEPFVEETWCGRIVHIGGCALRIDSPVPRCRTIDIAQDGVIPEVGWLAPLAQAREMEVAVYGSPVEPGRIAVGDLVRPR